VCCSPLQRDKDMHATNPCTLHHAVNTLRNTLCNTATLQHALQQQSACALHRDIYDTKMHYDTTCNTAPSQHTLPKQYMCSSHRAVNTHSNTICNTATHNATHTATLQHTLQHCNA